MQGERHNAGKPQLSYLLSAPHANDALAKVFEFGAQKYARDNWLNGLPKHEVADSLLRHLQAYLDGQLHDPESGMPHVAHIHWNALALAEFELRGDYASYIVEEAS